MGNRLAALRGDGVGAPVGWVDVVDSGCEPGFDRLGTAQGLVSGRPKRKGCDESGIEGSLVGGYCQLSGNNSPLFS